MSQHLSKYHIVGNHMSRLNYNYDGGLVSQAYDVWLKQLCVFSLMQIIGSCS